MSSPKVKKALCGLLRDPGNSCCADCKSASHPRWASWSLGVFVCIKCAGVHRSLGTHISKVKSVDLDIWKEEHLVVLVQMGSNEQANRRYEALLPESLRRPIADAGKLQSFIRSKYEGRKWVGEPGEAPERLQERKQEVSSSERSQECLDEPVSVGQSDSSSVLNLQLLSVPRARESSVDSVASAAASAAASTAAVRCDLKKSILSLYAKPQTQTQTPSPQMQTPQMQTPQMQTPQMQTPQMQTPSPPPPPPPLHRQSAPPPPLQSLEDNELFKNVWT